MGISVCAYHYDGICMSAASPTDESVAPALPEEQSPSHIASPPNFPLLLPDLDCTSTASIASTWTCPRSSSSSRALPISLDEENPSSPVLIAL